MVGAYSSECSVAMQKEFVASSKSYVFHTLICVIKNTLKLMFLYKHQNAIKHVF